MAIEPQDGESATADHQGATKDKEALHTATSVSIADTVPNRADPDKNQTVRIKSLARIIRTCIAVAGHVYIGWLCWLLTVLVFAVTVVYAFWPSIFVGYYGPIGSSIGNSILTLRLLSGCTDVMLSVTFAAALDRLSAILVNGPGGVATATMLAVNSGTSYLGLVVLSFGKGNTQLATRSLAAVRLLIVIVSTRQAFTHKASWILSNTEGMSFLNATRAPLVAMEIDRVFSSSMTYFLRNTEHAIDITPNDNMSIPCSLLAIDNTAPSCERIVYMPGSIPLALMTSTQNPEADIRMVFDIKGYVLRFGPSDIEGVWEFDTTECMTLVLSVGAVRLCLFNTAPNNLRARMVSCPLNLAAEGRCLTNVSWYSGNAAHSIIVNTTLETKFRRADVAFHRANNSIASHHFLGKFEDEANVAAKDLLAVYSNFALGSNGIAGEYQGWSSATNKASTTTDESTTASNDPGFDATGSLPSGSGSAGTKDCATNTPGSSPLFPMMPFTYLQSCLPLQPPNSRSCVDFLQNFLAIPLELCDHLRTLHTGASDRANTPGLIPVDSEESTTSTQMRQFLAYLGLDDPTAQRSRNGLPDTRVALAKLRYEIVVGKPSLVAYIAISMSILAVCFAILVVGTQDLESPGYWPFLEAMIKYSLMSDGHDIDARDTRDLNYNSQRRLVDDTMVTVR
ncbi:hypothetical protein LTR27_004861 [Elasticomyces elasticus]|nr:hypothetical protein LTR27_004861 [Elasticomyces elasticus]